MPNLTLTMEDYILNRAILYSQDKIRALWEGVEAVEMLLCMCLDRTHMES